MNKEAFLFSVLLLGWTWTLQVVHTEDDISEDEPAASPAVNATHFKKKAVCVLAPETGPCRAYVNRFFYNSNTKQCEIFVYGGCLGNRNNFKSRAQCMRSCHSEGDDDEPTGANAESD